MAWCVGVSCTAVIFAYGARCGDNLACGLRITFQRSWYSRKTGIAPVPACASFTSASRDELAMAASVYLSEIEVKTRLG